MIWESIASWSGSDWLAIVSGLLYVLFAARGKRICWVFGIISCSIIAWEDFTRLQLYADGVLQVIYIILGFTGLFQWTKMEGASTFSSHSVRESLKWGFLATLAAIPVAFGFRAYTDAAYPLLDAWTTLLSLAATWLTVKKILQNWIFWIIADLCYIFLYWQREAPAFAFLFIIYTIIAIYGWFSWRKMISSGHTI